MYWLLPLAGLANATILTWGCEKMFNHFFTASFLCISLWLHSNEEGKMVILPPYPHKMRLFLFMQFLVVVSAYGSIYLGFGQWQSNKSPVSLFSCSGVEYVCSRGHFFTIQKVPSDWMDWFILKKAPLLLSRFSRTSSCIAVSSLFMRTVRLPLPLLHFSA